MMEKENYIIKKEYNGDGILYSGRTGLVKSEGTFANGTLLVSKAEKEESDKEENEKEEPPKEGKEKSDTESAKKDTKE